MNSSGSAWSTYGSVPTSSEGAAAAAAAAAAASSSAGGVGWDSEGRDGQVNPNMVSWKNMNWYKKRFYNNYYKVFLRD